jgi:vanillate O-demethylase ferredoxin subunit
MGAVIQERSKMHYSALLIDTLQHSNQQTMLPQPFQIILAKSGKTYEVAANSSILETLEFEGRTVMSSCQQGVCGTCETRVIAGEIDHQDMVLMDDEKAAGDKMMICCSRALSPTLTLDL